VRHKSLIYIITIAAYAVFTE